VRAGFRSPAQDFQSNRIALTGLRRIYKPDFLYAKAGVMLMALQPASVHQGELLLDEEPCERRDKGRLLGALDGLNRRYGRGTVLLRGKIGDRPLF